MIPDLDIYRSANVLVKHHGQDAPGYASLEAAFSLAYFQGLNRRKIAQTISPPAPPRP